MAEEFQTPVFVLSDLDIGMNNWMSEPFEYPKEPFRRGKVLTAEQIEKMQVFHRYADVDGDGICYRTLPGNKSLKASYFTRGSGHTAQATYSERPEDWQEVLDRIAKKISNARHKLPQPVIEKEEGAKVGFVAYGSTHPALVEARDILKQKGLKTNYLRIRALPLSEELQWFVKDCDYVYVVEQNQQGQMTNLMRMAYPALAGKLKPVLFYDGMPVDAVSLVDKIAQYEEQL